MEENKNVILSLLRTYGLYTTFQSLNGALNVKKFWKTYLEDRKKEIERKKNQKNIEEDMNAYIEDVLLRAFNSTRTEKMDEDSEEYFEEMATTMNTMLEDSLNSKEVITEVCKYVNDLDYNPNDPDSRRDFLATMVVMQRIIPAYNPKDEESEDKTIAHSWLPVKKAMARKMMDLTQNDYKILYSSIPRRNFFNEMVFLPVHAQKIQEMTEEEFIGFIISTQDGMDGNNPIITLSKKQKKLMFNSSIVDEFYSRLAEHKVEYSLEEFQKLDDNKKYLELPKLKRYAESKYMPYTNYTEEEEENGYAEAQMKLNEEKFVQSPEFKGYLKVLETMTDEQFAYTALTNFSSNMFMKMYGKESEIVEKRLNGLNLIDLLAIARENANDSNLLVRNAIQKASENIEITEEMEESAKQIQKIYKCMGGIMIPITYETFVIPKAQGFDDLKYTVELTGYFERVDQMLQLDDRVIGEYKRLSQLDDSSIVTEINSYNKRMTKEEPDESEKEHDWKSPTSFEEYLDKAKQWLNNYYTYRILSLPKKLKGNLKMVKNGVLTDAITVTRNNQVMQDIKDMMTHKKNDDSVSL